MGWLVVILILNFGISWLNAWSCGKTWVESEAVGGWIRLVVWSGAIMSAFGFSSVYIFFLAAIARGTNLILPNAIPPLIALWYLTAIIPILGSGLIITIESWRQWYRDRDLLSLGTAGWNTYSQIHNAAGAVEGIGDALKVVISAFFDGDSDDAEGALGKFALFIIIALVVLSICLGILHTTILIKKYAGTDPIPLRQY